MQQNGLVQALAGIKIRWTASGPQSMLALALHRGEITSPLDALRRLGGYELAGICGCHHRRPHGGACLQCWTVSSQRQPPPLSPNWRQAGWIIASSAISAASPAIRSCVICSARNRVLDLDMALGEATGAALAIHVLRAAALCHSDMAKLSDVLKKAGPQA